jgi:hypothetical protein
LGKPTELGNTAEFNWIWPRLEEDVLGLSGAIAIRTNIDANKLESCGDEVALA